MSVWQTVARTVLSIAAALLFLPAWLWVFKRFDLNGWGFFHSGLPVLIGGIAAYVLLGFVGPFRRKPDAAVTARAPARVSYWLPWGIVLVMFLSIPFIVSGVDALYRWLFA